MAGRLLAGNSWRIDSLVGQAAPADEAEAVLLGGGSTGGKRTLHLPADNFEGDDVGPCSKRMRPDPTQLGLRKPRQALQMLPHGVGANVDPGTVPQATVHASTGFPNVRAQLAHMHQTGQAWHQAADLAFLVLNDCADSVPGQAIHTPAQAGTAQAPMHQSGATSTLKQEDVFAWQAALGANAARMSEPLRRFGSSKKPYTFSSASERSSSKTNADPAGDWSGSPSSISRELDAAEILAAMKVMQAGALHLHVEDRPGGMDAAHAEASTEPILHSRMERVLLNKLLSETERRERIIRTAQDSEKFCAAAGITHAQLHALAQEALVPCTINGVLLPKGAGLRARCHGRVSILRVVQQLLNEGVDLSSTPISLLVELPTTHTQAALGCIHVLYGQTHGDVHAVHCSTHHVHEGLRYSPSSIHQQAQRTSTDELAASSCGNGGLLIPTAVQLEEATAVAAAARSPIATAPWPATATATASAPAAATATAVATAPATAAATITATATATAQADSAGAAVAGSEEVSVVSPSYRMRGGVLRLHVREAHILMRCMGFHPMSPPPFDISLCCMVNGRPQQKQINLKGRRGSTGSLEAALTGLLSLYPSLKELAASGQALSVAWNVQRCAVSLCSHGAAEPAGEEDFSDDPQHIRASKPLELQPQHTQHTVPPQHALPSQHAQYALPSQHAMLSQHAQHADHAGSAPQYMAPVQAMTIDTPSPSETAKNPATWKRTASPRDDVRHCGSMGLEVGVEDAAGAAATTDAGSDGAGGAGLAAAGVIVGDLELVMPPTLAAERLSDGGLKLHAHERDKLLACLDHGRDQPGNYPLGCCIDGKPQLHRAMLKLTQRAGRHSCRVHLRGLARMKPSLSEIVAQGLSLSLSLDASTRCVHISTHRGGAGGSGQMAAAAAAAFAESGMQQAGMQELELQEVKLQPSQQQLHLVQQQAEPGHQLLQELMQDGRGGWPGQAEEHTRSVPYCHTGMCASSSSSLGLADRADSADGGCSAVAPMQDVGQQGMAAGLPSVCAADAEGMYAGCIAVGQLRNWVNPKPGTVIHAFNPVQGTAAMAGVSGPAGAVAGVSHNPRSLHTDADRSSDPAAAALPMEAVQVVARTVLSERLSRSRLRLRAHERTTLYACLGLRPDEPCDLWLPCVLNGVPQAYQLSLKAAKDAKGWFACMLSLAGLRSTLDFNMPGLQLSLAADKSSRCLLFTTYTRDGVVLPLAGTSSSGLAISGSKGGEEAEAQEVEGQQQGSSEHSPGANRGGVGDDGGGSGGAAVLGGSPLPGRSGMTAMQLLAYAAEAVQEDEESAQEDGRALGAGHQPCNADVNALHMSTQGTSQRAAATHTDADADAAAAQLLSLSAACNFVTIVDLAPAALRMVQSRITLKQTERFALLDALQLSRASDHDLKLPCMLNGIPQRHPVTFKALHRAHGSWVVHLMGLHRLQPSAAELAARGLWVTVMVDARESCLHFTTVDVREAALEDEETLLKGGEGAHVEHAGSDVEMPNQMPLPHGLHVEQIEELHAINGLLVESQHAGYHCSSQQGDHFMIAPDGVLHHATQDPAPPAYGDDILHPNCSPSRCLSEQQPVHLHGLGPDHSSSVAGYGQGLPAGLAAPDAALVVRGALAATNSGGDEQAADGFARVGQVQCAGPTTRSLPDKLPSSSDAVSQLQHHQHQQCQQLDYRQQQQGHGRWPSEALSCQAFTQQALPAKGHQDPQPSHAHLQSSAAYQSATGHMEGLAGARKVKGHKLEAQVVVHASAVLQEDEETSGAAPAAGGQQLKAADEPSSELMQMGMDAPVAMAVHAAWRSLVLHASASGGNPPPQLEGPFLLEFISFLVQCNTIPASTVHVAGAAASQH